MRRQGTPCGRSDVPGHHGCSNGFYAAEVGRFRSIRYLRWPGECGPALGESALLRGFAEPRAPELQRARVLWDVAEKAVAPVGILDLRGSREEPVARVSDGGA